jgi:hypothetical protein
MGLFLPLVLSASLWKPLDMTGISTCLESF